MHTNVVIAATLSDHDLLARLRVFACQEREATVELVAHLAVLDTRPALFAADGLGSLFSYCTQALALSEDAACNRIEAARACRQFPYVLDLLAAGRVSLTTVRLLRRHLTDANHRTVLARAANKSRREIEALVAELAPRPDAPSLVRKLPEARTETSVVAPREDLIGAAATAIPILTAPPPRSPSSTARSACCWRRSSGRSSARPRGHGRLRLSVRGRMTTWPRAPCLRAIHRARSSARCGRGTAVAAPTSRLRAEGARRPRSWSSTTAGRT